MEGYQHILLATDLLDDSMAAARKAVELSNIFKANISIIHVIDYCPSAGYMYPHDASTEVMNQVAKTMRQWGENLGIPAANQIIETGSIKTEILACAQEQAVDLIVLGSHGHHGLVALFGSTAGNLSDSAHCDVLSVKCI